jgi:cell division protein FtsZ
MSIEISPPHVDELKPDRVIGAGRQPIANMIAARVEGADFIVANTDAQALTPPAGRTAHPARRRITGGLRGSRPEICKAGAAEETIAAHEHALEGAIYQAGMAAALCTTSARPPRHRQGGA